MPSLDDSWKEEISDLVKLFEAMYFHDSHCNWIFDHTITLAEISHVLNAITNNKSTTSDGMVGDLIKYGSKPKSKMMLTLFNFIWNNGMYLVIGGWVYT